MRGQFVTPAEQVPLLAGQPAVVAAAAHELKSPLTLIHYISQMLADDTLGLTEVERIMYVQRLQLVSKRTLRLVQQLTTSYRLQDELGFQFNLEPVNTREVTEAALHELTLYASHHNQTLQLATARPHVVVANREIMYDVIVNLVDNAIRHNPVGGSKLSHSFNFISLFYYSAQAGRRQCAFRTVVHIDFPWYKRWRKSTYPNERCEDVHVRRTWHLTVPQFHDLLTSLSSGNRDADLELPRMQYAEAWTNHRGNGFVVSGVEFTYDGQSVARNRYTRRIRITVNGGQSCLHCILIGWCRTIDPSDPEITTKLAAYSTAIAKGTSPSLVLTHPVDSQFVAPKKRKNTKHATDNVCMLHRQQY